LSLRLATVVIPGFETRPGRFRGGRDGVGHS
jgi:hypothetical protein